jgi:hypothetical protein
MVFKKAGTLKNNERWHMQGHKLEIVSEVTYVGIKLESKGGWRRQKSRITTIGNQSLLAIDRCLTTMPNMRVNLLQQIYQTKCEYRMLHEADIWLTEGRVGNDGPDTGEIQQESAKNP